MPLNDHIRKGERFKISVLTFHFKKLERVNLNKVEEIKFL